MTEQSLGGREFDAALNLAYRELELVTKILNQLMEPVTVQDKIRFVAQASLASNRIQEQLRILEQIGQGIRSQRVRQSAAKQSRRK
jgi:hypothetical protein